MSGSLPSAIQNIQQVSVSNGKNPNNGQVFGVPLTLIGAALTLDLKTLVNLHRVNDVQGIFMDNSNGTAALQVSTTTGQVIIIPPGYQGVMPLYLSADKTITFNGNGTVNLVLLNFPTPANVWPTSANGGADVVGGQLLVSDGTTHTYLSEIVTNTAAAIGSASVANAPSDMQLIGGIYTAGVFPEIGQSVALQIDGAGNLKTKDAILGLAFTDIGGSVASGFAVQVAGVYNTSAPTLTNGQGAAIQLNAYAALQTDVTGIVPTYSASQSLTVGSAATDVAIINGSASKTVQVLRIEVNLYAGTTTEGVIEIIKRSTANSGGTSVATAVVPHDSSDSAGTAVVLAYTADPTPGTTVGSVASAIVTGTAASSQNTPIVFDFGADNQKPIILRGTTQGLAINLEGFTGGGNLTFRITWREV